MKNKINQTLERFKALYNLEYGEFSPMDLRDITIKYIDIVNNIIGGDCYIEPFLFDYMETIESNINYFKNIIRMLENELNFFKKNQGGK